MWPFSQQASEAERLLDALCGLHTHITDAVAGCDATEAERILRHMLRQLKGHVAEETP